MGGNINIPKAKESQLMAEKTLIILQSPENYSACANCTLKDDEMCLVPSLYISSLKVITGCKTCLR